jgi:hypothetical protein
MRSPPWTPRTAACLLVVGLVTGQVLTGEALPGLLASRRRRVFRLERFVAWVVGHAAGEVRAAGSLHHAIDHGPVDQQALHRRAGQQFARWHDLLAGKKAPRRRPAEQVVEVRVGAQVLPVAPRVGTVEVDQRGVEPQRRHRDQLLAVGVWGADRAQVRVDPRYVRAESGPDRQERQPVRGRQQAPVQHALVELGELDGAVLPSEPEVRFERDRVQRDEAGDDAAHPARGDQQTDAGPASIVESPIS